MPRSTHPRAPASGRLTAAAARRIALAAQGFGGPRAGSVGTRQLRGLIDRLGVLQLDSVNVFCRAHYLPAFSRLGPYPRELLDRLAGHDATAPGGPAGRRLFEYWGHMASLLPVGSEPLFRWRMARADAEAWTSVAAINRDNPGLVDDVIGLVRERGPIRASDTGDRARAATAGRDVELARRQDRTRVPVLRRPGRRRRGG